jgi:hypothetical protein
MPDLIDLLDRLASATRSYLYDSNPKNGVPRSIAHETRSTLTAILREADRALKHGVVFDSPCASAPPREEHETDPT